MKSGDDGSSATSRRRRATVSLPPAFTVDDIDAWAASLDLTTAQRVRHRLGTTIYWWLGMPSVPRVQAIWDYIPELAQCLDIGVLEARIGRVGSVPKGEELFGIPLDNFAPEFREVHSACVSAAATASATVRERAEAWLRPIAVEAAADSDLEAAIYFASRGDPSVTSASGLRDKWYGAVCQDVERIGHHAASALIEQAKQRSITIPDAAGCLSRFGHLPRFMAFRDEEEEFIDSTFLRAVDWFAIPGFDPWVDGALAEISSGPQSGIDPQAAWWLFHQLRSDLVLKRGERPALESWLWSFMHQGVERSRPWRQPGFSDPARVCDFVPMAAVFAFAWHRLEPASFDAGVVSHAFQVLFATQVKSGGWPLEGGDPEPNLLSTCAALHALALGRPSGWESAARRAAAWLETQQDKLGYWHLGGGPTVMLTVLALDSISLGRDERIATFRVAASEASAARDVADSEESSYEQPFESDGQAWHSPPFPEVVSVASGELTDAGADLLIVVATETELRQVLRVTRPLYRRRKLCSVHVGPETYYVGRFGVHTAAVVRCTMGTTGPAGVTLATDAAIRVWKPRAVLMPGIAFGMTRKKHRPGDVLVARSIVPYEVQRRGAGEPVSRAPQPEASALLLGRLRTPAWSFMRPDGSAVLRHEGPILSGEKLVDDEQFKAELSRLHPGAIGGEMEGVGLAAASSRNRVDWALVKGVCDWGDGRKNDAYQELAAAAAVSLCHFICEDEHALDGLHAAADDA